MNYKQVCDLMAKVGNDCGEAPSGMWAEKFAELIVRECANCVVDDDNAFDILKHFGVEE